MGGRPSDRAVAIAVHPETDAVRIAAVVLGGRVLRRAELAADVLLIGAASIPLERVVSELSALGPSSVETGQLP